jgi:hypothetical protein
MKHLVFLAAAFLVGEAAASTVTVETRIDSTTPQVISDRISAVSSRLGVNGPDDLGIDQAFASADVRTGEARFRALDGRQTGTPPGGSGASASASLQETLTFMHDPALGPLTYGVSINFTSAPAPFDDTFPLFDQPPSVGIGGPVQAFSRAALSILEPVTVPGVGQPFLRSFGVLEQSVTGLVVGRVGEANPPLLNVNVTEDGFGGIGSNIIGQTSRVTAATPVITASAFNIFAGSITLDVLVDGMLTFDVLLESSGGAVGGLGTYAGVASLNTARISLELPEGGTFTSGSGVFLSGAGGGGGGVPPIPAPLSLPLLISAIGGLALLRFRPHRGRLVATSC